MMIRTAFIIIIITFVDIRYFAYCQRRVNYLQQQQHEIKYGQPFLNQADAENCSLDMRRDLPKPTEPQPLYLKANTNEYWLPNHQGQLMVPKNTLIEVHCATTFAKNGNTDEALIQRRNTTTILLRCLGQNKFIRPDDKLQRTYLFRDLVCKRWMRYTIESLRQPCSMSSEVALNSNTTSASNSSTFGPKAADFDNGELYRIGFNINKERFIETMRVCHDSSQLRTLYVTFRLNSGNVNYQRGVKRLPFSQGTYFKGQNLNELYTWNHQVKRVTDLLNSLRSMSSNDDNSKDVKAVNNFLNREENMFLTRGHLAAKNDFIYANQQRSTFQFFNVAPQWHSFNSGQWKNLEERIHKFIGQKNEMEVDCYVGTLGTLKLPFNSENGTLRQRIDFHLTTDDNNNGVLPVPELFFKVLVDRSNPRRGVALLGINNPYLRSWRQVNGSSYLICDDIHKDVPWLHWIHNDDPIQGFLYACKVSDFVEKATFLPSTLRNTTEVLL